MYKRGRILKEHIKEKMKRHEFQNAWKGFDSEFELIESMLKARQRAGLTQTELARRIGTRQPALSRLESGGFGKATVETLKKIADALDARLVVKLRPKKRKAA
jgi:ribosome-binding protein aMBF1 (putative translation factor)